MEPKHTKDLPKSFFPRLIAMCAELEIDPEHLLQVMASESGVRSDAHNPHGHAVGLIQFMPATLKALGYREGYERFRHLSATEQLSYVRAYYKQWEKTGKPWNAARLYQATFLPATLAKGSDPGVVIATRGGYLGWAYDANAIFDTNGDSHIMVRELSAAIARNARGARFTEILARLREAQGEEPEPEQEGEETAEELFNLRTTRGVQEALTALGFDPGEIDGIPGIRTRTAIMAFQEHANIVVDGRVGPITRGALAAALAKGDEEPQADKRTAVTQPEPHGFVTTEPSAPTLTGLGAPADPFPSEDSGVDVAIVGDEEPHRA